MSSVIYPDQHNPLPVEPDATAILRNIREPIELVSGDTMYVAVAMSGADDASVDAAAPTIALRMDAGDPVTIPVGTEDVALYNAPGTDPAHFVAIANIDPNTSQGVFRVEVTVYTPGGSWEIHLHNRHERSQEFICVVADTIEASQQPWIRLPRTFAWKPQLAGGAAVEERIPIANQGTGMLRIETSQIGVRGDSDFEILAIPATVDPGSRDDLVIRYNVPVPPRESTVTYTITSNDTTVPADNPAATHNHRVTLRARADGIVAIDPTRARQGESVMARIDGLGFATTTAVIFRPANSVLASVLPSSTDVQLQVQLTILFGQKAHRVHSWDEFLC